MLPLDRIEIDFESQGCFHHEHYQFTVYGDDPKRVELHGTGVVTDSVSNVLHLSEENLAQLDNALFLYRLEQKGYCTNRDQISLSVYREGAEIAHEDYVDSTCACSHIRDILTFDWIAVCTGKQSKLLPRPVAEGSISVDEIRRVIEQRSAER